MSQAGKQKNLIKNKVENKIVSFGVPDAVHGGSQEHFNKQSQFY